MAAVLPSRAGLSPPPYTTPPLQSCSTCTRIIPLQWVRGWEKWTCQRLSNELIAEQDQLFQADIQPSVEWTTGWWAPQRDMFPIFPRPDIAFFQPSIEAITFHYITSSGPRLQGLVSIWCHELGHNHSHFPVLFPDLSCHIISVHIIHLFLTAGCELANSEPHVMASCHGKTISDFDGLV